MDAFIQKSLMQVFSGFQESTVDHLYANYLPGNKDLPDEDYISTAWETHQYIEVAVQLEGCSILQMRDSYYHLQPHQFCVIPPHTPHRICWQSPFECNVGILWSSITPEAIRTGYTVYSANTRRKSWGMDIYAPVSFLFLEILKLEPRDSPHSRMVAATYLKAFFMLLVQKLEFTPDEEKAKWASGLMEEIQQYVQSHLHTSITLQDLGNHVSLSPNYISRLYKQSTGSTISNYILEKKVAQASVYLRETTMTLSEIAERLGFYDQFHFSKVFKRYVGRRPSEYRSMQQQK